MTTLQRLILVRDRVNDLLRQHIGSAEENTTTESLLICNGHYCGRRFRQGDFSAIWFAEEDELKLYDAAGTCVESMTLEFPTSQAPDRNAA